MTAPPDLRASCPSGSAQTRVSTVVSERPACGAGARPAPGIWGAPAIPYWKPWPRFLNSWFKHRFMLSTALLPGAEAWSAPGRGWPCDRPPGPTLGAGSLRSFAGGGCCPRAVTCVAGGRLGGGSTGRGFWKPGPGFLHPPAAVDRSPRSARHGVPSASGSRDRDGSSLPQPSPPLGASRLPCPPLPAGLAGLPAPHTCVRSGTTPPPGRPGCRAARLVPDPSRSSPAPLKHPTPAVRRRSAR